MTAWNASPTMSVGLAPNRSAIRPQPIRPAIDESPETPRTVAASIAGTPWSIAWVTMWKIGPACAAQQAKCVRAIAQNCGARRTWPVEKSRWGAAVPPSATAPISAGAFRISSATGIVTSQARSPSTSIATRQSNAEVSQRASGEITSIPAPPPAHRLLERLEEDAEREQRALPDRDDGGGGGEDDPAVEESALTHERELR